MGIALALLLGLSIIILALVSASNETGLTCIMGIVVGALLILFVYQPFVSAETICNDNNVSYSFVSQISKATGDDPIAIAYALSFAAKNGLDIEEGLHWIDPYLTIDDVSVSIRKYGEN